MGIAEQDNQAVTPTCNRATTRVIQKSLLKLDKTATETCRGHLLVSMLRRGIVVRESRDS